jgi:hypothetical protein
VRKPQQNKAGAWKVWRVWSISKASLNGVKRFQTKYYTKKKKGKKKLPKILQDNF